jgi:hypothetical protein
MTHAILSAVVRTAFAPWEFANNENPVMTIPRSTEDPRNNLDGGAGVAGRRKPAQPQRPKSAGARVRVEWCWERLTVMDGLLFHAHKLLHINAGGRRNVSSARTPEGGRRRAGGTRRLCG